LDLASELALYRLEVVADRFEELDEIRLGPGCGVGHVIRSEHTTAAVSTKRATRYLCLIGA
jgi:hypothetical protein